MNQGDQAQQEILSGVDVIRVSSQDGAVRSDAMTGRFHPAFVCSVVLFVL